MTSDVLAQLDAAIAGTCPCGAPPREGSIYCGPDCEPTHISIHTDQRQSGDYATPMRWRPDLVTEADDSDLLPLGSTTFYEGRYHAQLFERRGQDVWHLRLDDGCRFVGADLDGVGDRIDDDLIRRVGEKWAALERELGNTRHLVADDDPWADVMPVHLLNPVGPVAERWYWHGVTSGPVVPRRRANQIHFHAIRSDHNPPVRAAAVTAPGVEDALRELGQRLQTLTPSMEECLRSMEECLRQTGIQLSAWQRQLLERMYGLPPVGPRGFLPPSLWAAATERTLPVERVHGAGFRAAADSNEPPTDPMERALWLRRNRNTGPAAQPLDPRRRGRR